MSQPQKKKDKQSLAEAAKVAARKNMSDTLWNKCKHGTLVTKEELTRLINMGADFEWKGPDDYTCLLEAALHGHLRTVQLLLSAGANKEAKSQGATPLNVAAQIGHVAVVNVLLAAGGEMEAKPNNGATPLYIAAQIGHIVIVKTLLAAGAEKEAKANDGTTPLFIAVQNGHIAVANALLAAGANQNAKSSD
jgi:ankyrin repeat protein